MNQLLKEARDLVNRIREKANEVRSEDREGSQPIYDFANELTSVINKHERQTIALIVKRGETTITFSSISKDNFGYWSVVYFRNNTKSYCHILDENDFHIKREPTDQEILNTAGHLFGRPLGERDKEAVLNLRRIA